jgi:hypothetical protein
MNYLAKPQHLLIAATLMTFLLSCSSVSVKTPNELESGNKGKHSLILLRLTAQIGNKLVDTSVPPIRGGREVYKLSLTNLTTGEAPEPIYPRTDRVAAPSKQAKSLGWIYFTVTPGDFDLEVSTWRFEEVYNKYDPAVLAKHYRLHVGQEAKVIYGGSFFTKCKDSILPNCDEAAPPIDESLAAEAIVKSTMANSGPFVTELLQP